MSRNEPEPPIRPGEAARSPWMRKIRAAAYAQVAPGTLDRWREAGLPFSVVGGTVLIHRADIDKYIREHRARLVARRHGLRGAA